VKIGYRHTGRAFRKSLILNSIGFLPGGPDSNNSFPSAGWHFSICEEDIGRYNFHLSNTWISHHSDIAFHKQYIPDLRMSSYVLLNGNLLSNCSLSITKLRRSSDICALSSMGDNGVDDDADIE